MNMKMIVTSKMLMKIIYFLMVTYIRCIMASGDRTLESNVKVKSTMCNETFLTQMNSCMEPFTKNVNFYVTTKPQNPLVNKIFIKYVCRKYEKMLLCVHTVLSNCPTLHNIQIVQNRLSISWALEINQKCNIHSNSTDSSSSSSLSTSNDKTTNNNKSAVTDRGSSDNVKIDKDSLDADYNRLLLPQEKFNKDTDFKPLLSETISHSLGSNGQQKTIPLSSNLDIIESNKIISNLNSIENNGNEKSLLQSANNGQQSEIITTVIKYKLHPRHWLSWILQTQSLVSALKSNTKMTQIFNAPKKSGSLLELIQVNVISNFNPNQIPNIAESAAPEQAFYQTTSAAKSLILQGHVSWHMILFLAIGNIYILSVSQ